MRTTDYVVLSTLLCYVAMEIGSGRRIQSFFIKSKIKVTATAATMTKTTIKTNRKNTGVVFRDATFCKISLVLSVLILVTTHNATVAFRVDIASIRSTTITQNDNNDVPLVASCIGLCSICGTTSNNNNAHCYRGLSVVLNSASSSSIHKDVLIVGAGLAGLSAALHIATTPTTTQRQVTVVDSMAHQDVSKPSNTAGSFAAAGMLAPQSERLLPGPYLDLCLKSRSIYPNFVSHVESLAKDYHSSWSSDTNYLLRNNNDNNNNNNNDNTATNGALKSWEVGFLASGGFIAPAFAGDSVETWAPPEGSGSARWLDASQVLELEPQLHPSVVGGWWFPEDASVDARRLTCSLRAACVAAGVHFQLGSNFGVSSLDLQDGRCAGVKLNNGKLYTANSILIANGSWMRNLLPVPIVPHKGQSLSLRMNPNQPPLLNRVLFAQDTYIVPKADGRIIVGATVEPGSFDPSITPAGIMHILTNAIRLVPELASLPLEECWSGLRPTTPDKMPILGRTPWENLFVAGGYWRNGVLLAPKTGQIMGDLLMNDGRLSSEDEELLEAFSWDRFVSKEGGLKMAALSRIAAATYPTQQRAKGFGISASVGTELGFYSSASSAVDERRRDRDNNDDDLLERAAQMGLSDASLYDYATTAEPLFVDTSGSSDQEIMDLDENLLSESTNIHKAKENMATIYKKISQNKVNSLQGDKVQMGETLPDESDRPDPGFRIHHVDSATPKTTLIPPYTRPEAFLANTNVFGKLSEGFAVNEYSEETYDGYEDIIQANGAESREEELAAMKRARQANRDNLSDIDMSKVGAQRIEEISSDANRQVNFQSSPTAAGPPLGSSSYLNSVSDKPSVKDDDLLIDAYTVGSSDMMQANDVIKSDSPLGDGDDNLLERAAQMGLSDASLYDYATAAATGKESLLVNTSGNSEDLDENLLFEAAKVNEAKKDMATIYEKIAQIKANSLQGGEIKMGETLPNENNRADPGFRIHHVDSVTQKTTLIPPYTRPEAFLANTNAFGMLSEGFAVNEYNEETYDGYVEIIQANGAESREVELAAMKRARQENRDSLSDIDMSKVGAQRMEENSDDAYRVQ